MSKEVHGHDVLNMMISSGKAYTRASLQSEIEQTFGKDATYLTCSAKGMTALGLIDFLEGRGKFLTVDGKFTTDPSKVCSHDGPHNH